MAPQTCPPRYPLRAYRRMLWGNGPCLHLHCNLECDQIRWRERPGFRQAFPVCEDHPKVRKVLGRVYRTSHKHAHSCYCECPNLPARTSTKRTCFSTNLLANKPLVQSYPVHRPHELPGSPGLNQMRPNSCSALSGQHLHTYLHRSVLLPGCISSEKTHLAFWINPSFS